MNGEREYGYKREDKLMEPQYDGDVTLHDCHFTWVYHIWKKIS